MRLNAAVFPPNELQTVMHGPLPMFSIRVLTRFLIDFVFLGYRLVCPQLHRSRHRFSEANSHFKRSS
jgi:hypothetical protein